MSLTVASYNIHRSFGHDRRCDPERIVAVLDALEADIVALQEVETPSASGHNLLHYLAVQSGMTAIPGPIFLGDYGHYGNALLTTAKVHTVRHYDLALPGREPRGAIDADLVWHGVPVRVVATHLGLRPGERRWQTRRLLKLFEDERDERPLLLLGDFNEWFPWSQPLRWLHSYFEPRYSPPTFPSRLPLLPLDRIWARPRGTLVELETLDTPLARRASDHLPIRARLLWPIPLLQPELSAVPA